MTLEQNSTLLQHVSEPLAPSQLEPSSLKVLPVETFIENHSRDLAGSRNAWSSFINLTTTLREERFAGPIRESIGSIFMQNQYIDANSNPEHVDRATMQFINDLSVYMALSARAYLYEGLSLRGMGQQRTNHLSRITDPVARDVITNKNFPRLGYDSQNMLAVHESTTATKIDNGILTDLVKTYELNPNGFFRLAELCDEGEDEVNTDFSELRRIIATDWHSPYRKNSITRSYLETIVKNPFIHLDNFGFRVAADVASKELKAIRDMARFALINTTWQEITPKAIQEMVANSFPRWAETPEVEIAFGSFANAQARRLEDAFSKIAGVVNPNDVRALRTEDEVVRFSQSMFIWKPTNRSSRRQANKGMNRDFGLGSLPNVQDLENNQHSPRKLAMLTTSSENQGVFTPCDEDEILQKFKVSTEKNLDTDVVKIIQHLKTTRDMKGQKKLHKTLKIAGKSYGLWRFAPNDVSGLRVSNPFHRVVYTVIKNQLVIFDVLDHASFDKKYS